MKKNFFISILCILFLGTGIKTVYSGVPNIDSVKAWKNDAKKLGVNLKDYTLIKEYKKVYDIASITKDSVKVYKSNASKLSINLSDYLTFCIALAPKGVSSTGTSNYIPKFTDNKSLSNSNIYQNSNYLGINTTTASASLELKTIGHSNIEAGFKITDNLNNELLKVSETARISINGASNSSKYGTDDATLASKNSGYTFQHAGSNLWLFDNNQHFQIGLQGSYIFMGSDSNHDIHIRTNGTNKLTIKTTGIVNLSSCPTSSTGLVSGDIWRNGTVLNIIP